MGDIFFCSCQPLATPARWQPARKQNRISKHCNIHNLFTIWVVLTFCEAFHPRALSVCLTLGAFIPAKCYHNPGICRSRIFFLVEVLRHLKPTTVATPERSHSWCNWTRFFGRFSDEVQLQSELALMKGYAMDARARGFMRFRSAKLILAFLV